MSTQPTMDEQQRADRLDAAYKAQIAVETNDAVVVGVNKFQTEERPLEGLLRVDESVQTAQVAALKALRSERDNAAVTAILGRIETAAQDPNASLMPLFVEAVEAYATLGEICNVLRRVFGEYEPGNWV